MKWEQHLNLKRKWEEENHCSRKLRRLEWQPQILCDVDVLQGNVRDTVSSQIGNIKTNREVHAAKFPINCDPIDGISANLHAIQTRTTYCARCLQGESGHFQHVSGN